MENILILFACGFLGVFIHCCIKANSLIVDAEKANINFTVKDYLNKDALGISVSIAMIFLWFLIFGEVGAKYPKIIDFIRTTFGLMGFFGSYIAQKIFSRGKQYINNVIDKKTNIADNIQMLVTDPPPPEEPIVGDRPNDRG